jgi:hypothetical protein
MPRLFADLDREGPPLRGIFHLAGGVADGALLQQDWPSSAHLIRWLYASTLSRSPNEAELSAARELLTETPTAPTTADLLWALLMQPEFLYVQ